MKNKESILVLSRSTPPRSGGTPSILANQLSWFDNPFVFVGTEPHVNEIKENLKTHWKFYGIKKIRSIRFLPGYEWLNVFLIMFKVLSAVKKHKCKAIVLLLLDQHYIVAGYLLSFFINKPLIIYIQDLYSDAISEEKNINKWLALKLEKQVIRRGKYIITNIPGFQSHYKFFFNVNLNLVPNCYPKNLSIERKVHSTIGTGDKLKVGFCGSIYWNNLDNLKNLCNALSKIPDSELHIFGSQSIEDLERLGLDTKIIRIRFIPVYEILNEELSKCEILFLPFTFSLQHKIITENAFPTKVHDYLICQRPILLHCPEFAYLTTYFKHNNAAHVVNENNADAIYEALVEIINNPLYQTNLAASAFKLAEKYMGGKELGELGKILDSVC
jgi:glycosyltransferase involved in cell wall biosynthesis